MTILFNIISVIDCSEHVINTMLISFLMSVLVYKFDDLEFTFYGAEFTASQM